jgi:hypothetical protein
MREGFEGRPPSLYVNFSALPASGLLHIFQVPLDLENLFPVESAGSRRASDIALSIPSHYGRLIETESISLLRFLRALN